MQKLITSLIAVGMLLLAACGTGGEVEPDPITPKIIEVVASEFAFDPAELTVSSGDVITLQLRNDGLEVHNFVITGLVFIQAQPGRTAEGTFTVPDEGADFLFRCSISGHQDAGMEGRLLVVTP